MKFFTPDTFCVEMDKRKIKVESFILKLEDQIKNLIHDNLSELSTELQSVDISNMNARDNTDVQKIISNLGRTYYMQSVVRQLADRLRRWESSSVGLYFTVSNTEVDKLAELSEYLVPALYSEIKYGTGWPTFEWGRLHKVLIECEVLKAKKEVQKNEQNS